MATTVNFMLCVFYCNKKIQFDLEKKKQTHTDSSASTTAVVPRAQQGCSTATLAPFVIRPGEDSTGSFHTRHQNQFQKSTPERLRLNLKRKTLKLFKKIQKNISL